MQKEEKRKPDFETRLNGVRLAVWANETDGRRWYSASPTRRVVEAGSKEAKYFRSASATAAVRDDWLSVWFGVLERWPARICLAKRA